MSRREFRGQPVVRVSAGSLRAFNKEWRGNSEPRRKMQARSRRADKSRPLTARPLDYVYLANEESDEPHEVIHGGVRRGERDTEDVRGIRDDAPIAALFDDPEDC